MSSRGRSLLLAGVLHSVEVQELDGKDGQFPARLTVDPGTGESAEVVLTGDDIVALRAWLEQLEPSEVRRWTPQS